MRLFQASILSAGLLLAFSSVAAADGAWQTVSLDNNPEFTIDVPASVGGAFKPSALDRKQGGLMYFSVDAKDSGELFCVLDRKTYSGELNARQAADSLKTPARNALCTTRRNIGVIAFEESEALTSNGFPAGRCAASFYNTNKINMNRGGVSSVMQVAAPDALYQLTCTVITDAERDAKIQWGLRWAGEVHHIQESLRLPSRAK